MLVFLYLFFLTNIFFSSLISLQTVSLGSHILKQVFYMVLYLILDVARSMADLTFSLDFGSRSTQKVLSSLLKSCSGICQLLFQRTSCHR